MKAKEILAAVFTAICLASCILDQDMAMYLTGLVALILVGLDDIKVYFRTITKIMRNIRAWRSIRKEVVKA